jgi:adenylate cyclase
MALKADLEARLESLMSVPWDVRAGNVVPKDDDVKLSDGLVELEAAYLYADLADSTALARDFNQRVAARVVRSYLYVMSRIMLDSGGAIRSFDGDRVMGIFIGDSKRTTSAKCALRLNWAFKTLVRPKIEAAWPGLKESGYTLEHSAGIDVGKVSIVRGGVRGSTILCRSAPRQISQRCSVTYEKPRTGRSLPRPFTTGWPTSPNFPAVSTCGKLAS